MKVIPINNYEYIQRTKYKNKSVPFATPVNTSNTAFNGYAEAMRYAKFTKPFNKFFNRKFKDLNFKRLEGIQEGLKSFEGLSIKQIAFAFSNLHAINMISGCTNHCLHCYANAQPFIKRYPFEDLKQICDDVKELGNRVGVAVPHHQGQPYINCSFDSDGIDDYLFDKNGNKHDFIEIAKMFKDSLGYKPVLDTNGWKRDDKVKQAKANELVQKLMEDKNYENFYQINISINPFNPSYVRAINSGYSVDELYQPLIAVGENELNKKEPEKLTKAKELYTNYIKDVANTLITFKPLLNAGKLSIITRVLDNSINEMKGFRIDDFVKTLSNIANELQIRSLFGEISEQEVKNYINLLERYDTRMFTSGRMERFYGVRNKENFEKINRIDTYRTKADKNAENIIKHKKLSKAGISYLKMMAPDGKIYLYDNYSIIPTDIQLKTSTPDIEKPFKIPVKDFVVTTDMIDYI